MRKIVISVCLALCCVALHAKDLHAPLPPGAYAAKSIAIVNNSGKQNVADKAYTELEKWGRFKVVDPTSADIVLVISVSSKSTGATSNPNGYGYSVHNNEVYFSTVSLYLNGQHDPFYSETERANIFQKSATKRCIDEFQKRLAEPH